MGFDINKDQEKRKSVIGDGDVRSGLVQVQESQAAVQIDGYKRYIQVLLLFDYIILKLIKIIFISMKSELVVAWNLLVGIFTRKGKIIEATKPCI